EKNEDHDDHEAGDGCFILAETEPEELPGTPALDRYTGVEKFRGAGGNSWINYRQARTSFERRTALRRSVTCRILCPASPDGKALGLVFAGQRLARRANRFELGARQLHQRRHYFDALDL